MLIFICKCSDYFYVNIQIFLRFMLAYHATLKYPGLVKKTSKCIALSSFCEVVGFKLILLNLYKKVHSWEKNAKFRKYIFVEKYHQYRDE